MRFGFVMDPLSKLDRATDTSLRILRAAQERGHTVFHIDPRDLAATEKGLFACARQVRASADFRTAVLGTQRLPLSTLRVIFLRKDPPFDESYYHLTLLLERLPRSTVVINHPRAVREVNEKMGILDFDVPRPRSLVTASEVELARFWLASRKTVVVKPLDDKGGHGVMKVTSATRGRARLFKRLTRAGDRYVMAQAFVPAIARGDKRILILGGKFLGAYLRVPRRGEFRTNLSLGAEFRATTLSARERAVVRKLGPELAARGLHFVGIDLVSGRLLEINVTSPAGLPELAALGQPQASEQVVKFAERLARRRAR